jgi:hypothetical protein
MKTMLDDLANRSPDIHWPAGSDPAPRRCTDLGTRRLISLDNVWPVAREQGDEFVPHARLGWFGFAPGTARSFYHTWFLAPVSTLGGEACRVVTDEVGIGKDAAHLRATDESLMHRGHDLWRTTLKWIAESR